VATEKLAIEGNDLTHGQRNSLHDMTKQIMVQAGHPVDVAADLATKVFATRLYEKDGDRWRARSEVKLSDAGAVIHRGKFWRREQIEEAK